MDGEHRRRQPERSGGERMAGQREAAQGDEAGGQGQKRQPSSGAFEGEDEEDEGDGCDREAETEAGRFAETPSAAMENSRPARVGESRPLDADPRQRRQQAEQASATVPRRVSRSSRSRSRPTSA